LTRVRQAAVQARATPSNATPCDGISLFGDVVILDHDKKDFLVGTVQRIQKKDQTRGHVEYRNPVPFNSLDKDKIRVVVTLFDNIGNDDVGDIAFRNKSVVKLVEARHILCSATLTFNTDTGIYYMSKEDYQCVANQVASCFVQNPPRQIRKHTQRRNAMEDDGSRVVVVRATPVGTDDGGLRRSGRERRAKFSLTY
jgi:hypothetical protein